MSPPSWSTLTVRHQSVLIIRLWCRSAPRQQHWMRSRLILRLPWQRWSWILHLTQLIDAYSHPSEWLGSLTICQLQYCPYAHLKAVKQCASGTAGRELLQATKNKLYETQQWSGIYRSAVKAEKKGKLIGTSAITRSLVRTQWTSLWCIRPDAHFKAAGNIEYPTKAELHVSMLSSLHPFN